MGKLDNHHNPRNLKAPPTMSRARTPPPSTAPEIITYRLDQKMVYVKTAETHKEAIQYAKTVFADELGGVAPERISFTLDVTLKEGGHRQVQISPMVWKAITVTLKPYEIIELHVQPEVIIQDADGLPQYADIADSKESKDFLSRPGTPREKSRSPSPSPSSSRKSPSPSRAERAINWLEKRLDV